VVLAGRSDLAEIAAICGLESNVTIIAVVDAKSNSSNFLSFAAVRSYDDLPDDINAVIVTDLSNARETARQAIARYGADRVLIPELLRLRITDPRKGAP
jgi:nanoRNase/pAp phosphatase (c-di-AMP/oligoRNAs hydrolase)